MGVEPFHPSASAFKTTSSGCERQALRVSPDSRCTAQNNFFKVQKRREL
jgi:hypothetical protein